MNNIRRQFAELLLKLTTGKAGSISWNKFIATHYSDDRLEEIRRDVVRLSNDQGVRQSWTDSEIATLRDWAAELLNP